jgi:hypothetical protein
VGLFGEDDHANGGQHPVDSRYREELTKNADLEQAEQDLNDACCHTDCQGALVSDSIVAIAQGCYGPQRDDNQPRRRSLDGQLRV